MWPLFRQHRRIHQLKARLTAERARLADADRKIGAIRGPLPPTLLEARNSHQVRVRLLEGELRKLGWGTSSTSLTDAGDIE